MIVDHECTSSWRRTAPSVVPRLPHVPPIPKRVAHVMVCLLIVAGCQDHIDIDSSEARWRDARVVVNHGASWTTDDAWHIGATPTVIIGEQGRDTLFFSQIRGAFTLSTGEILVVNGGPPPEIRVFDSSGAFRRSWGGSGGGPGEFQYLIGAWQVSPDTLVAFDYGLGRITRFDLAGHVLGTTSATPIETGQYLVNGRFEDGQWLLVQNLNIDITSDGRVFREVARATEDGSDIQSIGRFEESTLVRARGSWMGPAFYPGFGLYVAHGNLLYRAYPNDFEIDVLRSDGTPVERIRRTNAARESTSKQWDALLRRALAKPGALRERPGLKRALEDGRVDSLPAFGDEMLVGSQDFVWLRNFDLPSDTSVAWSVFDTAGTYLGDVQMPPRFHPTEIGQNRILGIWRDSLDVETVREYELIRHG